MHRLRWVIGIVILITLAGPGFAGRPPKPCPEPPAEGAEPVYTEIEVANPGTLAGRVIFKGEYKPMRWKVVKDREFCGDSVIDESLVAGKDGGLKWVVVSIDGISAGKPYPRAVKEMANKDCRYQPHVDTYCLCDKMMVTNHDPILHNTHAYIGGAIFEPQKPDLTHDGMLVIAYEGTAEAPAPMVSITTLFNLGLPSQEFKPKKTMRKTGLLTLKCDAGHTWMTAYVWVFDHPYSAVTGDDGEFSIADVPAGEYTVTFWHETLGEQKQKVVVEKGETAKLDVTFTLK